MRVPARKTLEKGRGSGSFPGELAQRRLSIFCDQLYTITVSETLSIEGRTPQGVADDRYGQSRQPTQCNTTHTHTGNVRKESKHSGCCGATCLDCGDSAASSRIPGKGPRMDSGKIHCRKSGKHHFARDLKAASAQREHLGEHRRR